MPMPRSFEKTVKIPVRIVDDQIEILYGGALPLPQGKPVVGELTLPADCVLHGDVLSSFQQERVVTLLPPGAVVLLGMKNHFVPPELRSKTRQPAPQSRQGELLLAEPQQGEPLRL